MVDASGRRSKLPSWLEEAGYQAPAETHVDSHIGYCMRLYELPEQARASLHCCDLSCAMAMQCMDERISVDTEYSA